MYIVIFMIEVECLLIIKIIVTRKAMPPVEQLGAITKWMSDPPQKDPIIKPLVDDIYASWFSYRYGVGGRETLRVEDRVKTLYYQPNIDFLRSQNCFALIYQWPSAINLPSMTLSLNAKNNVDIQKIRMSAPSGCIVVLVGGKYLQRMNDIVRMVDHITSQLAIKLVTYFAEKTEVMPVVDLDNSPAIVGVYKSKPYTKAFIVRFSSKSKTLIQNNIFSIYSVLQTQKFSINQ